MSIISVLRRRWITFVATVIIAVGASIALDLRETKIYKAVAVVYLNPIDLANQVAGTPLPATDSLSLARSAQTQASIASSPQIAAAAAQLADIPSIHGPQLSGETTIVPESDADLLDFSVSDQNPTRAMRLANAYAGAYTSALVALDTKPLQLAISKLRTNIESHPDHRSPLYANLVEKEQQLESLTYLETSNASVVKRPVAAPQIRPRKTVNGLLALLLGIVLGGTFVWWREQVDGRVRDEEEVSELLGVPLLGKVSLQRGRAARGLVTISDPFGPAAEGFRLLRANLESAALVVPDGKVWLASSAQAAEGKSTTVANLAVTFARLGKRVLVVDLDFRKPRQAALLQVSPRRGVTDVISGTVPLEDAIVTVDVEVMAPEHEITMVATGNAEPVHLLSTGAALPFNVGDYLAMPQVSNLLRHIATTNWYDYVLVDTPPMVPVADALAVLGAVDAIVVIARAGVVTRASLRELRRLLASAPAPRLGYILTGARDELASERYGYGYTHLATGPNPSTDTVSTADGHHA